TNATKATARILGGCADAAASLAAGGDCAGARTPQVLAGCIGGSHDADAATGVAVAHAAHAALPGAALRCQGTALRRARSYTPAPPGGVAGPLGPPTSCRAPRARRPRVRALGSTPSPPRRPPRSLPAATAPRWRAHASAHRAPGLRRAPISRPVFSAWPRPRAT